MPGAAFTGIPLAVWVKPHTSADAIVGWRDDTQAELCIRVRAVPEGGKANAAVIKLLAASLDISQSDIRLIRGHKARRKLFSVAVDESLFESWKDSLSTQ